MYDNKPIKVFLVMSSLWLLLFWSNACAQSVAPLFEKYKRYIKVDTIKGNPKEKCSCLEYADNAPDLLHPEYTPHRFLKVNVHYFCRDDGSGNFSGKEAIEQTYGMIWAANEHLANNQKMNLPPGNQIVPRKTRYSYVLTGRYWVKGDSGIYVHKNTLLYDSLMRLRYALNYRPTVLNKYFVSKDTVLNIFMIEPNPDSIKRGKMKMAGSGVGYSNCINIYSAYFNSRHPVINDKGDTIVVNHSWDGHGALNHEIGHSLGLQHTWYGDECADTPDNQNCFGPETEGKCKFWSNNVMDYNLCQCAFTACQLGKVHTFFNKNGSTSRRMLEDRWCYNYSRDWSIVIKNGEKINFKSHRDYEGDLVIMDNSELTVHCMISLPPGANLIIAPGSTLILDGGAITQRCGKQWNNIIIMKKGKLHGSIFIKNDGKLERFHEVKVIPLNQEMLNFYRNKS